METISRNYNLSDTDMTQDSKVKRQHFLDNIGDFTAFDPDFTATFATAWLTAINASEAFITEETRDDQLGIESADVKTQMVSARAKYAEVKYFILKAFPSTTGQNKKIQDEFGLDDYDEAANSHPNMVHYLKKLHGMANVKYKTQLLAAGYTQLKIDVILTIHAALNTQDIEQEVFADQGPGVTVQRINTHNTTYLFLQKVSDASKVIYATNLVGYNLFLQYPGNESDTAFSIKGNVTSNSLPLKDVFVKIIALGLEKKTNSSGNYGFGALPAGVYAVEFSKAGFVTQTLNVTVPPTGFAILNAVMVGV